MDIETTKDSLSDYMLPFLDETGMTNEHVLMDGARYHTSSEIQLWLDDNNINYIPYGGKPIEILNGYPPNSPDLNPIENVFAYWDAKVANLEPKNIEELIKIIKEEWSKIPLKILRNCIKKLPEVMKWVDDHNGLFYKK